MFKSYTETQLLELRNKCDEAYYNSSTPILTDEVYDLLEEELVGRGLSKLSIGHKLRDDIVSVELPFYLGSMDKIKSEDEAKLARWLASNKAENYVIESKLDGVSCLLVYNSKSRKLYTRGDGHKGSDISHLLEYINLPKIKIDGDYAIRGELILDKTIFENEFSSESCNARNMVSGIVNSRSLKTGTDKVEFVAYEIMSKLSPSLQLHKLRNWGFTTVYHKIVSDVSIESLQSIYKTISASSKFEMDGLIIYPNTQYELCQKNNPKYAIAFKPDNLILESKVIQIEWNVSRHGLLKPRVQIEPVKLRDITIQYATGHNARFIVDNGIGHGAVVLITRSGDVIPKIVGVIKPGIVELPKDCSWNENKVELYKKENTSEQDIKSITSFFQKIDAKFVSEQTIKKLYNYGADTILKIIQLKPEEMVSIKGIETKLAKRIYENIRSALENASDIKILGASGVFGFGIGITKVEALIGGFSDILSTNLPEADIRSRINAIEGFSNTTTDKIISNLTQAKKIIKDLEPYKSSKKIDKKITNRLGGYTFVFSGFRDKDLEENIKTQGGKVVSSVSKNLTYLVVKNKTEKSSKISKAQELGIKIIDKEELSTELDF